MRREKRTGKDADVETVGDIAQAVVVTGAAILTGRALVTGVLEEVHEIIALMRRGRQ